MNISKAQKGTIGLPAEENDQPPGYSKFEVYGIHNLKFVARASKATYGPAALIGAPRELEVEVQATLDNVSENP